MYFYLGLNGPGCFLIFQSQHSKLKLNNEKAPSADTLCVLLQPSPILFFILNRYTFIRLKRVLFYWCNLCIYTRQSKFLREMGVGRFPTLTNNLRGVKWLNGQHHIDIIIGQALTQYLRSRTSWKCSLLMN